MYAGKEGLDEVYMKGLILYCEKVKKVQTEKREIKHTYIIKPRCRFSWKTGKQMTSAHVNSSVH